MNPFRGNDSLFAYHTCGKDNESSSPSWDSPNRTWVRVSRHSLLLCRPDSRRREDSKDILDSGPDTSNGLLELYIHNVRREIAR